MRLLINGPLSSSKQTKHIKAKFFLTKDKLEDGDVKLEYFPTELMWIDMYTKPKQGTPFWLNWSMSMNILVEYDDGYEGKTLTLCFCRRKKKHSLFPTSIPTLKLDIRGLRILITEGVCYGTVPTAHLFQLLKPRPKLPRAELAC